MVVVPSNSIKIVLIDNFKIFRFNKVRHLLAFSLKILILIWIFNVFREEKTNKKEATLVRF